MSALSTRPLVSLDDKYQLDKSRAYMTGIEALVRLPMLQHQRDLERGLNTAGFISGYRGSPLGGVDQAMWKAQKYLDEHNIRFVPGVNEDLAATAVRGSQEVGLLPGAKYDGVFGMWYGKGPGVDRSMDVIKHANANGTSKYGGVLCVAGDDHACKSSTLPHQSEHMFIGASIPVLAPANVQEVLDLGIYGWEMSRYCGCWVALKAITENMDSAISAEVDHSRVNIVLPDFELPEGGVHVRWPDKPLDQEVRLNKYKIYAAIEFARVNKLNKIVIDSPNARLGIVTSGKAYLDVMQALEDMGIDEQLAAQIGLRVYKVGMVWPLEPQTTHEFAKGLEEILVVEEKRSIIEDQLTGQLYNWPVSQRPKVVGEFDESGKDLMPNLAELTPAMVARALAARMRRFYQSEVIEKQLDFYLRKEKCIEQNNDKLVRKPHYCSGCPHNTSTQVPSGSIAMGGIGCHYMSTFMTSRPAQTFTQMGGEGAAWVGQAGFTDTKHVFQNLGDGTYFHSGILAIRQAVAAKVNITYKILYNDAVAMTGGQSVDGDLTVPQLVLQLRGEGVNKITVVSDAPEQWLDLKQDAVDVFHRDELDSVQQQLREISGTTVLIYQQGCAAEKRRKVKKKLIAEVNKRVLINTEVCEGCGDCGKVSNCLSVVAKETELGRKREIDQSACNKDFSCVKGFCPSFVSVIGGQLKTQSGVVGQSEMHLPEPTLPSLDRPWNTLVTGVGGTGVLTIASLLAMAAHIEGKGCATMNQTGLAQKFGPVVSHLRIAQKQEDIFAVRIAAGDADLLLACDLVVGGSDEAIAKVNLARSHAVVNSAQLNTSELLSDIDLPFPQQNMMDLIKQEVGADKVAFINASDLAVRLLGDSLASNLFLLGFAYQQGLVAVHADAIIQAIEINKVAIDFNKQAFVWGRRAVVDKAAVFAAANLEQNTQTFKQGIDDVVDYRAAQLENYQNKAYAQQYVDLVNEVRGCEAGLLNSLDNNPLTLSSAVAKALHKLMAYKDEYEVARLFSNGDFVDQVKQQFSGDYKLQFHLAPSWFGKPKKRTFASWMLPMFKLLAKGKFLRGTVWDIFAYSTERKLERSVLSDFKQLLKNILPQLTKDNYDLVVELVNEVEKVRGFGHVKQKNIERYRQRVAELLPQINGQVVRFVEVKTAA